MAMTFEASNPLARMKAAAIVVISLTTCRRAVGKRP